MSETFLEKFNSNLFHGKYTLVMSSSFAITAQFDMKKHIIVRPILIIRYDSDTQS